VGISVEDDFLMLRDRETFCHHLNGYDATGVVEFLEPGVILALHLHGVCHNPRESARPLILPLKGGRLKAYLKVYSKVPRALYTTSMRVPFGLAWGGGGF